MEWQIRSIRVFNLFNCICQTKSESKILFVEDVKLSDDATEDTTTINTLGNNIISAPKLQTANCNIILVL